MVELPEGVTLDQVVSVTYRCTNETCQAKWVYGVDSIAADDVPTECPDCTTPFADPDFRLVGEDEAPPKTEPPAEPNCRRCRDRPPYGFTCNVCGLSNPPTSDPETPQE